MQAGGYYELNLRTADGSYSENITAERKRYCKITSPTIHTTAGSASQGHNPLLPETTHAGTQPKRMKLTGWQYIYLPGLYN